MSCFYGPYHRPRTNCTRDQTYWAAAADLQTSSRRLQMLSSLGRTACKCLCCVQVPPIVMTQVMRLTVAALVLCTALVAPALATRQLKQTGGTINFPGCTFLSDSEIARNKDFSSLYAALQASGLNDTLSNLTGPATLFAPTNEAFAEFLLAANVSAEDALASPYNRIVLENHVVPGAFMVCQYSAHMQMLVCMLNWVSIRLDRCKESLCFASIYC